MDWFNLRRDGLILLVFILLVCMLGAGLYGAYRVFAYAFVGLVGVFTGLGFVRRRRPVTWLPPVLATVVLGAGFTGILLNESVVVQTVADGVMGFHPATAFLVYVVWIPPFFTLGVSFAALFRHVSEDTQSVEPVLERGGKEGQRDE